MQLIKYKNRILFLVIVFCFLFFSDAYASRVDELKDQINDRNAQMNQIQKEIEEYQAQLEVISGEKTTLKNEISRLEITAKKLNSDIFLTKKQAEAVGFNIERLGIEITNKNNEISDKKDALAESIRNINESESQSLVEITLSHDRFSDFFGDMERMQNFQKGIGLNLEELRALREILENEKAEKESEKSKMERLESQLIDQKVLVDSNKTTQNKLLKTTQNKESTYKKLLEEKLAKKLAFEKEISELESQLKIEIDPNSIPSVGSGVLSWPLDKVTITQYFGNTPFATANPQVYNGAGHTGIDFRATIGTPIKAALSGTVEDTGNTDLIRGCYSYGKWVLIRHSNGLSTLYAHLSLIKVIKGQSVTTGQVIGYSGDTGYATGPHLHFGVYATQGVKVMQFTNSVNCKNAFVPIADKKAYLNPLSYL